MNQILSINGGMDIGKPSGFNVPTNNKKEPLDIRTTVLIFAIVLITFGIIITTSAILGIIFSGNNNDSSLDWPKFETEEIEGVLYVTITHNKVIDKVTYKWGNGFETEEPGNGEKIITLSINIPAGDNILNMVVIDNESFSKRFEKSFIGVETVDELKPKIDLSRINSKLTIIATVDMNDDAKLAYLTYRWNNEQEIRIDATNNKSTIETQIVVPKGQNSLTVKAVKENGVFEERTQQILGSVKPVIDIKKTNDSFNIIIKHDSGIRSADIKCNGKVVALTEDHFGPDKKVVELSARLTPGIVNTISITAISWDGAEEIKEYQG